MGSRQTEGKGRGRLSSARGSYAWSPSRPTTPLEISEPTPHIQSVAQTPSAQEEPIVKREAPRDAYYYELIQKLSSERSLQSIESTVEALVESSLETSARLRQIVSAASVHVKPASTSRLRQIESTLAAGANELTAFGRKHSPVIATSIHLVAMMPSRVRLKLVDNEASQPRRAIVSASSMHAKPGMNQRHEERHAAKAAVAHGMALPKRSTHAAHVHTSLHMPHRVRAVTPKIPEAQAPPTFSLQTPVAPVVSDVPAKVKPAQVPVAKSAVKKPKQLMDIQPSRRRPATGAVHGDLPGRDTSNQLAAEVERLAASDTPTSKKRRRPTWLSARS